MAKCAWRFKSKFVIYCGMESSLFVVLAIGYAAMMSLPFCFFRRDGRRNTVMWWVTASPFAVGFASAAVTRFVTTETLAAPWRQMLTGVPLLDFGRSFSTIGATLAGIGSVSLIAATVASHRVPIALWHQPNDAPVSIVTHGPYSRVRHPFYAAFIVLLLATVLACRSALAGFAFVYGSLVLNFTAAREERKLGASAFGDEYRSYIARTRRFIPRL
jgi:protein-S-isoprenylcysteine O-methyltransferase Ste14